ncbi:MAG: hypothetical protein COB50_04365 [Thiotrichales bacterium]|nr:MAG: hypothetical protein COB50_04365 [Thiotrichales bacterium]
MEKKPEQPFRKFTAVGEIVELIDSLMLYAAAVKSNPAQCKRLAARVAGLKPVLQKAAQLNAGSKFYRQLLSLKASLQDSIDFVKQFTNKNWFKKVLYGVNDANNFARLNKRLQCAITDLNLGIAVQQLFNHRDDAKDAKADLKYLRGKSAEIKSLNKVAWSKMHDFENSHKENCEFQRQAFDSIDNQLDLLLQQKRRNSIAELSDDIPQALYCDIFFERDKILAKGSFATIYLGTWQQQPVVVKWIHGQLNKTARMQLLREIKIMSRLNCPYITQLYAACLEQKGHCLLMERVSKGSLRNLLNTSKINYKQKYRLALTLAKGIAYMHRQGVLHCDLKSANILVDAVYNAKITDFGLAQSNDKDIAPIYESSTAVRWLAPETLTTATGGYSKAADIYSYGIVLWEIVMGYKPFAYFKGDNNELRKLIVAGKKQNIPSYVPETYAKIISSCWEHDPSKRYSLETIIDLLEQYNPSKPLTAKEYCGMAMQYEEKKNHVAAFKNYFKSAELGYYRAQTQVGIYYRQGHGGVSKNKKTAIFWYKRAAARNHARAQYNLGICYGYGDGVAKDLDAALIYFQKAKAQGYADAATQLQKIIKIKQQTDYNFSFN